MAARLSGFQTLGLTTSEIAREYYLPALMQRREAQRAAAAATRNCGAELRGQREMD